MCAILCSILTAKPVKWIEDNTGNLSSTGFGRDMYLDSEMALTSDGQILAVRYHATTDQGAFYADAQPTKFKIGLVHSSFACYDVPVGHITAQGMYTNKAPGGVAYRCSFRVTEAMFFQERMMQAAADDLGLDQAEFRRRNLVDDDQFPYRTPFGFLTDSGQYHKCLQIGLDAIGYDDFLVEQAEARKKGRLLGIGISTMTEPLGGRQQPRVRHPRHQDVRLRRAAGAPDRQGRPQDRRADPGPGPRDDVRPDRHPRAGHPGARHRRRARRHRPHAVRDGHLRLALHPPVAGAATAMVARKIRAKARKLAAHLLEVSEEDVEWELGRFYVRGAESRGVTIQECAMAAYSNMPDGMEPGLENNAYYDPPNLTWPFAATSRRSRSTPRPGCGTCCGSSPSTTAGSGSTR